MMMKRKLRWTAKLCGAVLFGFGLIGCAEDYDDFFTQHIDDIAARDAEDAAIRAELATEIENLRTEITGKIAIVEGNLHNLIEQGGLDVLDDLATKSQSTREAINTRYSQFTQLMDQKFGTFENNVNSLFQTFDGHLQQLETELQQAIAQNNQARAQEIQQFINKVKGMEQTVNTGVQTINAIQNDYSDIIAQADLLLDLEKRMQTQTQRYDQMLASLDATLTEAEARFEAQKETDLSTLSAAEIQDYKDKLAVMSGKLTEMQQAMAKLEEMKDEAQQILTDFEDLVDKANDLDGVIADVQSAYDMYAKVEDILTRIDNVDTSYYEGVYDSLSEDLATAHNDMASACAGLLDVKDFLEGTRDTMKQNADYCEAYADYCEGRLSEIQDAYYAIPFPS